MTADQFFALAEHAPTLTFCCAVWWELRMLRSEVMSALTIALQSDKNS